MALEQDLIQEFGNAVKALRDTAAKGDVELKALGTQLSETKSTIEKINGRIDELTAAIKRHDDDSAFKKLQDDTAKALEEFEATLKRMGSHGGGRGEQKTTHQIAFNKFLRGAADLNRMVGTLSQEEKALIEGNDQAGGYLAPMEFVQQLIQVNIPEISNVRPLCTVRTTSRFGVKWPTIEGNAAAQWVSETGNRAETTNPRFGVREIRTNELYAMVPVSQVELEDSAFDIEAMLREQFSMQFGVAEGAAFISGDGAGKPEGMLTHSGVTSVNSGDANLLTADGLVQLTYSLKPYYMTNPAFILNRNTSYQVRILKDGEDRYLWNAGIDQSRRPNILGFPYVEAQDMPSIAANAYPVLFGDFRRAYVIVDRLALEVMSDPYKQKASGMVEISARRRVGGQLVIPEAIVKQKIAA